MFTKKYLKQLQGVQLKIKNCKESISKLSAPTPSGRVQGKLYCVFEQLAYTSNLDINYLVQSIGGNSKEELYQYLREIGNYLVDIADSHKLLKQYEDELAQLRDEEHKLKSKLGIV